LQANPSIHRIRGFCNAGIFTRRFLPKFGVHEALDPLSLYPRPEEMEITAQQMPTRDFREAIGFIWQGLHWWQRDSRISL
jgi:hypothetical protein